MQKQTNFKVSLQCSLIRDSLHLMSLMCVSLNLGVQAPIFGHIYAQTPAIENPAYK